MIGITFAGLLLAFWCQFTHYPYFASYDMEWSTVLDCLLINSGQFPGDMSHPGLGMYLILQPTTKAAHAMGLLAAADFNDIHASLNPLLCGAQLTDFVRGHAPFLMLASVLLMWLAVRRLSDFSWRRPLLTLLVLGVQEPLFYHAARNRSEQFGMLYLLAAVLLLVLARPAGDRGPRPAFLAGAGLLAGLAFTAKVQFLLYGLVVLPLLWAWLVWAGAPKTGPWPGRARRLTGAWTAAAAPPLAAALLAASYPAFFDSYTYAVGYGPGPAAWVLLACTAVPGLWQLSLALKWREWSRSYLAAWGLGPYYLCLLVALLVPALLYPEWAKGLDLALFGVKQLFLRSTPNTYGAGDLGVVAGQLWAWCLYQPAWFAFPLAGLLAMAAGRALRAVDLPWGIVGLSALLLAALAGAAAASTRFVLRDALFIAPLLVLVGLMLLGLVCDRAARAGRIWRGLATILCLALLAANAAYSWQVGQRRDLYMGWDAWHEDRFLGHVYDGRENRAWYAFLNQRMGRPDDTIMKHQAQKQARHYASLGRLADFVLPGRRVSLRQVGPLAPGWPVWTAATGYRLAAVPPALDGAVVVDPGRGPDHPLPRKPYWVDIAFEGLPAKVPPGVVWLRPRNDRRLFLLLPRPRLKKLLPALGPIRNRVRETGMEVRLDSPSGELRLAALQVTALAPIPAAALGDRWALAVAPRTAIHIFQ